MLLPLVLAGVDPAPRFDPVVDDGRMVVLCDPDRFRLSVRASADAASLDRGYPERRLIDPAALIEMLPQENGSMDLRGYLVRYERCGPYTVRFEGDAYNANVQGESGAYDSFAKVSVIWGRQVIYPAEGQPEATRLTACDRSLSRAQPCPTGYAVRIDGWYDAKAGVTRFDEHTKSDDEMAGAAATRRTVQHYAFGTDQLAEWWRLAR